MPDQPIARRSALLAGLGAVTAIATPALPAAADFLSQRAPNPFPAGEAAHVTELREQLDAASAGASGFTLDEAGRRIVTAEPLTHVLHQALIIGGNTALVADGATFVANLPVEPKTWTADRVNFHSATPTYTDEFETVRATVSPTLLLNHVPSTTTGLFTAPGNIRVQGGVWDPTAYYLASATGADLQRGTAAPPMNALTFTHTHHVEVVGVTVRNVKWWHAVELNGVKTATVRDCRFEGYIENPTSGLWSGDAVQLDLPYAPAHWAGAPDHTPACDVRIIDNWCGPSSEHPGWAKLGISHSSQVGKVYDRVWVERNTCEDLIWDAVGASNVNHLVMRENTVINCRGGLLAYPQGGALSNPMTTIDVVGNTIAVAVDANNRPAVGVYGRDTTQAISDAAVYGNIVISGTFKYPFATFRRPPQTA